MKKIFAFLFILLLGFITVVYAEVVACSNGETSKIPVQKVLDNESVNSDSVPPVNVIDEAYEKIGGVDDNIQPWMQNVEYTKQDSAKIVKILNDAVTNRNGENQIMYFGKQFLGIPYVAHTLENGDREHLIVNVHGLDCTTFVETILAMKMCDDKNERSFEDFCSNLMAIRYRDGKMVDYTSRLHYFTWWGEDNEQLGIVKQVVAEGYPTTAIQKVNVNYMTQNPNLYKQLKNHPEFVPVIRKYEQASNGRTYRYIPKSLLNQNKAKLGDFIKDGDIASIITKKAGLDTSHIVVLFWKNGVLHIMHASSLAHKVILDTKPFYDYMMSQPNHLGIRVYRPQKQQ